MISNTTGFKIFFTRSMIYIKLPLILTVLMLLTTACSEQVEKPIKQSSIKNIAQETKEKNDENLQKESEITEFSYPDLDGKIVKLSDYRGKWVVVNFWATWCPPCRKEIPDFVRFKKEFSDKVEILGINNEDGENDKIKSFIFEYKINYPVLRADVYQPSDFSSQNTMGLPTTVIFNPQGVEVSKTIGPIHYSDLVKLIDL